MKKLIAAIILMQIIFPALSVHAAGLYSTPEFRGRIIDAETKEPIEGAVAVALYDKEMLIGGPGGPNSYVFHAKETLTDKKGEFYFPSYSSLLIFTKGSGIHFIFYKPGYMSSSFPAGVEGELIEKYFSSDVVGKETTIHNDLGRVVSYKGPLGIVDLKRAKTREDFMRGSAGAPSVDYRSNQLPLLFKAINEDRKNRGLEGEVK